MIQSVAHASIYNMYVYKILCFKYDYLFIFRCTLMVTQSLNDSVSRTRI